MIVIFTVAWLISLYLIAAFLARGQMVASFFSTLMAVFLGLCICTLIPRSFSDKTRELIGSVVEDKSARISEYEDKKERKYQEEKKAQEQKVNQKNETE